MFWFSAVVNSVELLPQQISENHEKRVPKTKNINSVELSPQEILVSHFWGREGGPHDFQKTSSRVDRALFE